MPTRTISKNLESRYDMVWTYRHRASYTIERYQKSIYPFRENLTDKVFNGHIARFSEGNYCGFGWQICLIEIKEDLGPQKVILKPK
jgi:hypothetical protein